jgi:hypothetical protein
MADINIHRSTSQIDIDTSTRNYHLPIASATTLGGIKVGNNLTIEEDGTLNAESTEYNLPVASSSTLGGVKIGSGLSISDAVASVNVDSTLDADSLNPLRNSVITSNLNTLTSSVQSAGSAITSLSTTVGTLSGTVSTNTSSITTLSSTVSGHTTAIQANTDSIASQASTISDMSYQVNDLDSRLITAESTLSDTVTDVTALKASSLTPLPHSSLLPATSWSAGNVFVAKRGKVGYVYFELEGSLTIAAGASVVLYTFVSTVPAVRATATLLSDAGVLLGEVDDYSYELKITNMSASSMTITKLNGSIPLVFA